MFLFNENDFQILKFNKENELILEFLEEIPITIDDLFTNWLYVYLAENN